MYFVFNVTIDDVVQPIRIEINFEFEYKKKCRFLIE